MSNNKGNNRKDQKDREQLYAEVGKFFSLKGDFDEKTFRDSLKKSLTHLKNNHSKKETLSDSISTWLTTYLAGITHYLNEKNMPQASLKLITAAIEESSKLGIDAVIISGHHLKMLLSCVSSIEPRIDDEEKKHKPDKKREKIFDAAIKVFGQKGYHKATIDEIASFSGVGKGSVYRYFKSKKDLINQLLKETYNEIIEQVIHIFSVERDMMQQVQKMIEFWVGFIEDNPVLYKIIHSEESVFNGEEQISFYDYVVDNLPMFKERILALNREKRLKTTNFYTVFYGILGFIDGVAHKWFRRDMSYPLRDEIPVILEVVFNGFIGETKSNKSFISILKKTMESITNPDHS